MTERGRRGLGLRDDGIAIGPSALRWDGAALVVSIAETAVPHLGPLRGTVRVAPLALNDVAYRLDAAGRHWWRPVAPVARVEAAFERPDFRWRGDGYFDMNWGEEPLEAGFRRWDWARAAAGAETTIFYDAERRDGSELSLALRFDGRGVERLEAPPRAALPRTLWRVRRRAPADLGASPEETRRLEDAPFYARAELATRLFGAPVRMMHETFDGDRFAAAWVKRLLPFRMPRRRA